MSFQSTCHTVQLPWWEDVNDEREGKTVCKVLNLEASSIPRSCQSISPARHQSTTPPPRIRARNLISDHDELIDHWSDCAVPSQEESLPPRTFLSILQYILVAGNNIINTSRYSQCIVKTDQIQVHWGKSGQRHYMSPCWPLYLGCRWRKVCRWLFAKNSLI